MPSTFLNRFTLALAVGTATVLASAGCAGSKVETKSSSTTPADRSADAYAAEALAAYQVQRDGGRALSLIDAAVKQSPARVDLAYMQASLCSIVQGCPPEQYEARLRKLDSGNAVVWMRTLSNAQRQRDATLEIQVLDAIGRSERFDLYWNSLAANLTLARTQSGMAPKVEAALNETIGWLSATIVPDIQTLTQGCSKARTADSRWAERCKRVAQVLLKGDTYLAESIGLALAKQTTADPIELAKLDERARTSRYLWRTARDMVAVQVERDKFAGEQLELMRQLRREQDVQAAIVRWSGRPMMPPNDFRMDE